MEKAKKNGYLWGAVAAVIWIAALFLFLFLWNQKIAEEQRREKLALLGRLESLYSGETQAFLTAALLQQDTPEDAARGAILLEETGYGPAADRRLRENGTSRMLWGGGLALGLTGLLIIGVVLWQRGRRLRELEETGNAFFRYEEREDTKSFRKRSPRTESRYLLDCLLRCRRQMERENAEVEKEKKELARYLENISHQIKTPLAGIVLTNEYLEERETDSEKQQLLRQNRVQLESIQTLVRQLLQMARLDAGAAKWKLENVTLQEVFGRVQKVIYGLQNEKQVQVDWDYEKERRVFCDCFWLQEALINLLTNAIDHLPERGQVHIWAEPAADWTEIHIRDNGPGIPPEHKAHLFRRFYTQEVAETGAHAGIGLQLAHEIVSRLGGQLDLVEHEGEGTWFRLRLYA